MTKRKEKCAEVDTVQILMEKTDGSRMYVTIPSEYEVTFAPLFARTTKGFGERNDLRYCVRVYALNPKRIRAVFADVISFRDVTMPVSKEIITEKGAIKYRVDENGEEMERKIEREVNLLED